ncbi:MAG: hypothetical protein N6V49_04455, partial [Serratia symbiotica]|nr:hypothetical protein [Serratia symbiotica]
MWIKKPILRVVGVVHRPCTFRLISGFWLCVAATVNFQTRLAVSASNNFTHVVLLATYRADYLGSAWLTVSAAFQMRYFT